MEQDRENSSIAVDNTPDQSSISQRKSIKKLPVLIVTFSILIIGLASFLVFRAYNGSSTKSYGIQHIPLPSSINLNNSKASSIDTSNWQTHTDPIMKVKFQYPDTLNTKNSRVKLYPTKASVHPEIIQNELSVEAEIVLADSRGILTPVDGVSLIDIITYAPGSFNDKRSRGQGSQGSRTIEKKSIIISGTKGDCLFLTDKSNKNYTRRDYNCKFNRANIIYEITGGPSNYKSGHFAKDDLGGVSQKMLETLQFTE